MQNQPYISSLSLLLLADLGIIPQRTALNGGASWLDALIICPGMHLEDTAVDLNEAEYPATAALTTGYPFRIENPGTVCFLQRIARTAHLTTLSVAAAEEAKVSRTDWKRLAMEGFSIVLFNAITCFLPSELRQVVFQGGMALVWCLAFNGLPSALPFVWFGYVCYSLRAYIDLAILGILVFSRLLSVYTIRQRVYRGGLWKGASEPGVHGDLLVLLTQDRWVRIKGLVDDLKAVTSGLWLADPTSFESSLMMMSRLLVYVAVALNFNAPVGVCIPILATSNTLLLSWANFETTILRMHGRQLKVEGVPKKYARRRDLADELIQETGRSDWAVALGMVPAESSKGDKAQEVVM